MTLLHRLLGPPADGKIAKLRALPELAPLSDAELARVASAGELALIPAGTVLLQEGQRARWCYVVLGGSVLESNETGSPPRPRAAGEAVAEPEILTREPAPATVVAGTDLVVLAIGSREFSCLLDTCPGFSRAVHVSLSHRALAVGQLAPSPRPVLQLVGGA
jgi:CRP-like cAMP-binding protein